MAETALWVCGIACTLAFACELTGLVLRAGSGPRARRVAGTRLTLRRDRRGGSRRVVDRGRAELRSPVGPLQLAG